MTYSSSSTTFSPSGRSRSSSSTNSSEINFTQQIASTTNQSQSSQAQTTTLTSANQNPLYSGASTPNPLNPLNPRSGSRRYLKNNKVPRNNPPLISHVPNMGSNSEINSNSNGELYIQQPHTETLPNINHQVPNINQVRDGKEI